jgi:ADP-ribose pyrophosphatase YjhB (NUDIX family)
VKPFRFCPACASELERGSDEGFRCSNCGRSWYRNSAPAAGAAIVKDGKALVTERGIEPKKGLYDIPGGFLEAGEHPVEALKRELREELGVEIEVDVEDCISMVPHAYGDEADYVLALGFLARWVGGELRAADDVAAFRWVDLDELETLDFAWEHDRTVARTALLREKESSDGRP